MKALASIFAASLIVSPAAVAQQGPQTQKPAQDKVQVSQAEPGTAAGTTAAGPAAAVTPALAVGIAAAIAAAVAIASDNNTTTTHH